MTDIHIVVLVVKLARNPLYPIDRKHVQMFWEKERVICPINFVVKHNISSLAYHFRINLLVLLISRDLSM